VPIGRPTPGTRLYVLDGSLEPLARGVIGELYVGGDQIGMGYWNRRTLTAERFVADPYADVPGARMYRTGDLARWDDNGVLHYLGRADQQVKIRGYRIEPAEIEAALAAEETVAQAAVVVQDGGRAGKQLVAYFVPAGEGSDAASLRRATAARLPDYMVPSAFVPLATLPLTPNGKVDRRLLAAKSAPADRTVAGDAPRGDIETGLADIWSRLLGVPSIGRLDDFFTLGGHSLLAIRVPGRVRDKFGVELSMRDLFEARTLAALAVVVQALLIQIPERPASAADESCEEVDL
jgi:acyl carrier protein